MGKAKSRKQTIIDAATRLFAEQGFKETSVAEIAAATSVAEGTIFYHFKSKEQLLLHILETLRDDIVAEHRAFCAQRASSHGLDMVDDAISFYLYLAAKLEDRFLLLYRHDPYRLAESNPSCRGDLEEIFSCLVDIFEEAVRAGQQDGSITALPARKLALLVFTMVDGLVRFKEFNLYNAAALHSVLVAACRRMLAATTEDGA